MKAKIVGIDPGTTIGIVSIDEDGNIDFHFSGKNISTEKIVEIIKNIDGVVLISTDKHKIPKKIIEISSKLNLGIYYPKKDVPLSKKRKFYNDDKLKNILKNTHEIDAYISAYFALIENKEIFLKAKRISKDYKEYIEILRKTFKNRKLEPFAVLEILKESKKEKPDIKKKKIRKKTFPSNKNLELEDLKIIIKKNENENNQKSADNYLEKYLSLLNDYNILSKLLVDKLDKNSEIVPKISFLIKNNLKSSIAFLDILDNNVFTYLSKYNPEIYVTEDKIKNILNLRKEIFVVKEYVDIKNFIILKSFEKRELKSEDNIEIEKIKKLIDSLR
ncbi:MAG: DUF460 domain-containing protein [Candidatus Aenigmatarchaeota archaeon]